MQATIHYANGVQIHCDSLAHAIELVREWHDNPVIETFPDRTLCWHSEAEANNDNGYRAFASIREDDPLDDYEDPQADYLDELGDIARDMESEGR